MLKLFLILLAFSPAAIAGDYPADPSDGQIHVLDNGSMEAWDSVGELWLSVESFWLAYADRHGGLTWGRGIDYPPYAEVSVYDTVFVELASGSCLMRFFHTRWRRAQDVRRWDKRFNKYGGCPNVFE